MAIQLSTSDLVAIGTGAVQLIASVALAVWTVRRTVPPPKSISTLELPKKSLRSFLWAWAKSSWLFVLFCVLAFYQVWTLAVGTEELSKPFVLKVALYSTYGALNAVAAIGFFIVEFQLGLTIRLAGVVEEINLAQGRSLKSQQESLAVTQKLLAINQPKKRRPR